MAREVKVTVFYFNVLHQMHKKAFKLGLHLNVYRYQILTTIIS